MVVYFCMHRDKMEVYFCHKDFRPPQDQESIEEGQDYSNQSPTKDNHCQTECEQDQLQ